MKAIVTGGSGFIGTNLCIELQKEGHETIVLDNLSSGYKSNEVDGVEYVYDTLLNKSLVEDMLSELQPDVIFHFAAIPRVSYSIEYPLQTTEANVLGLLTLLESVRNQKHRPRVVASSSSSVYGGADLMPTPESHPTDPKSPYALQKQQGEQWCAMYAELYGMDVASLRYFNVFGPFSRYGGAYSTVMSAWLYSLYVDTSVAPFIEGDGEQTRDFCFVDNVVQANLLAAKCDAPLMGDTFNVAQGGSYSLLYVKKLLEKISGKTLDLDVRDERLGDVKHTLANIDHAKNVLGYNPTDNFDEQVEVMANWYRTSYPK